MVAGSSQTKLGDQVGTLGEEVFEVAFGPRLDGDGLVGLILPLDPVGGVGGESAGGGDDQHINPRRFPQTHLLRSLATSSSGTPLLSLCLHVRRLRQRCLAIGLPDEIRGGLPELFSLSLQIKDSCAGLLFNPVHEHSFAVQPVWR